MESSRGGEDRLLKPLSNWHFSLRLGGLVLVDGLHSRIGIVRLLPYHFSHWANTPWLDGGLSVKSKPLGERALLKLQKPDG